MITAQIILPTISDVKEFVGIVNGFECEVDLLSGRYAVDAKSIMGIFSLDLSKPLKVNIQCDTAEDLSSAIEKFKIKE
jgi:phosphotransferase system HPr-like phosphotransfer protein